MARSDQGPSARGLFREGILELRVSGLTAELALATVIVGLAAVVAWSLTLIAPGVLPGVLLFPALLAASMIGGWRSGVAAGILGVAARVVAMRVRSDPIFDPNAPNMTNLAIFVLAAAAVVALGSYVRFLIDSLRASRNEMSERNLRYATLFDTVPEGFAVCEAIRDETGKLIDYTIVEINPALQRLLNVGAEAIGSRLSASRHDWTRWLQLCDHVLTTGRPVVFERFNRAYNLWHEVHLTRISEDRIAQFFFDITERKASEARQAELFDELNHRVKNNLAMVAGLLQLQARGSGGTASGELLKAADRVHSIAEVHAALTRGAGTDSVDFASYLEELCLGLRQSLAVDKSLKLGVEAEPALIKVETAIPLGMVVNELVTNAVKYAYLGEEAGPIDVGFRRDGAELLLTVRDTGRGLPKDAVESGAGLGMRLVRSLVDQVGGELKIRDGVGAWFEIRLGDSVRPASAAWRENLSSG